MPGAKTVLDATRHLGCVGQRDVLSSHWSWFYMEACGSLHPCPRGEIPPVQSLILGMWVPAPGTELSWEPGGNSHWGKAAGPVTHGTALEGLRLGNLGAVIFL